MNKVLFLLVIVALTASSCKVLPPQYKGLQNPRFERIGLTGVKFGADICFYNPNAIKCRIQDIALDVTLDNKPVGTVGEQCDVPINRKSDFTIPVGVTINPQGTIFENLTTIFELFRDKQTMLALQGNVKVKVLGMTFPIPVKYQQQVRLSQLKSR